MRRRTFLASTAAGLIATATSKALLAAAAEALGPVRSSVAAIRGDGRPIVLTRTDVEDLRRSLRGVLLTRDDTGYDDARRIWNAAFDRHPALIARCAGPSDVAQAVNFARAHRLLVAVRGGGHSLSGQSVCEDGLMIDVSPMKGIRIDHRERIAYGQSGLLLGDLDRESQFYGLATPAGTVSHTGVAGLTLGGGTGRLARKYGLTCDQVKSVDIVTADGQLLIANEDENADLFWGVRGGGGNFGIVTQFDYRLHEVAPAMFGGVLLYPFEQAREVLRFLADYTAAAPDELWLEATVFTAPNGQRGVAVDVSWCGSVVDAERALASLLRFGKPAHVGVGVSTYVDIQRSQDETAKHGQRSYMKAGFTMRMHPQLIDTVVDRLAAAKGQSAALNFVTSGGGAIARVASTATAFSQRSAPYTVLLRTNWTTEPEREARIAWQRDTWRAIEPHTAGFYTNTMTVDHTRRDVRENYGANYGRLLALKRRYDPGNLFRMNANIDPRV